MTKNMLKLYTYKNRYLLFGTPQQLSKVNCPPFAATTLREDIFASRYFRGRYFREFRANSRKYLPRN